jgi:MarR-like DNA-binding transcriptional regulator SgrR of sgrS sRNA
MSRRVTIEAYLVAAVLAATPEREWYVTELAECLGSHTGGVTQLLQRLQQLGWVLDRWESGTSLTAGRGERHYYRLNPEALPDVDAALRAAAQRVTPLAQWAGNESATTAVPVARRAAEYASTLTEVEIVDLISAGIGELRRRAERGSAHTNTP